MNLNPITALSEQLQKLINEHGSASILRDHLALFKDQVVILEKKSASLEAENAVLKAQNGKLESETEQLKSDNSELRKKIQIYEQPSHNNLLEEVKAKILVYLASNEASTADEIAPAIEVNLQIVKFHLEELFDARVIDQEHNPLGGNWWTLKQEGRRLLIINGLIS